MPLVCNYVSYYVELLAARSSFQHVLHITATRAENEVALG